jgi:hypothetical protein
MLNIVIPHVEHCYSTVIELLHNIAQDVVHDIMTNMVIRFRFAIMTLRKSWPLATGPALVVNLFPSENLFKRKSCELCFWCFYLSLLQYANIFGHILQFDVNDLDRLQS